jgi:uncharacterized protein YkwD
MPSRLLAVLAGAAAVLLGAPAIAPAAARSDLLAPSAACPNQTEATVPEDVQEATMRCMINHARVAAGVPALSMDTELREAAVRNAHDIVACGEFSHSACGLPFPRRIADSGYAFRVAGENLAWATGANATVRAVLAGWLRSPAHRANLLNPAFREQGLAVLTGADGATVWVGQFATPRQR